MEYILNELSLCGQYKDANHFATEGMKPLLGVIKTLSSFGIKNILKKSTFYDLEIAHGKKLNELFKVRISPSVLAVRSQLSRMQGEPYWDLNSQQESKVKYLMQRVVKANSTLEDDITGTGVAEAYVRKGCLISFLNGGFDENSEKVRKENEQNYGEFIIVNIHDKKETEQFLFESGIVDYKKFIQSRYCGKLIFDELSEKNGLNLVNGSNFKAFFASFKDFENYSWQQIITSDGFDYKEFHKNKDTKRYFTNEQWNKKIHKFRISQEIRCFGYREGDKFHLLRIDLDHILSDKG